jgi:hypothetical protein
MDTKQQLLNIIIADIFKGVTTSDILRFEKDKNAFFIGDREVGVQELIGYKNEALELKNNKFLREIVSDLNNLAIKKLAKDSKTESDIFFPKAMLYCMDLFMQSINAFASLEIKEDKKQSKSTIIT